MLNYPTIKENLSLFIDARFPILYINTFEESKADGFIATEAKNNNIKDVLEWNGANGFVNFKTKVAYMPNQTLEATLQQFNSGKDMHRKWLVIKDATAILNEEKVINASESSKVIALLKDIARKIRNEDNEIDAAVIIIASTIHIPKALEKEITVLELNFPDDKEIRNIVESHVKENNIPTVYPGLLEEICTAFKGLTEYEINNLLSLAGSYGKDLTKQTLQLIHEQKRQMIMKAGILEMIQVKENIEDIGGLENLKEWLQKKAKVFKDMKKAQEFGVVTPKGVMIAGMPGCGKSLCAKAAGNLFDVPLLRLDMGRLMGKYVGESEENLRKAIQLAEAISPCVLWIDEIEKAFAGAKDGGSEVTTRMFGTILTWMQEKTSPVFVLATANKIDKLPPELSRKGRFDDVYYVDLPNSVERKKIFEIHIEKRKQSASAIDFDSLVSETEGYAGADIEGVVNESVENIFVEGKNLLTTDDLLSCIRDTHSLSEVMKDEINEMGTEYQKRKLKKASR